MRPAITVVVPCRNEEDALRACLSSLLAQEPPAPRHEIIVVDGGSTDGTARLAERMGVKLLHDGANGPSGARNIGIRHARGDIVAFTDADCVPSSDWLTRIAEVFAEDERVAGVAGALRMPRETFLGRLEDDEARALYRGFITSNVAYRRDVLLGLGGFDESLQCAEDYDLAWRALDAGYRVVHDPRPVVMHAPPEVAGPLRRYLAKQMWYAKNDVPAHLAALRRHQGSRAAPGSASAVVSSWTSARDAALLALGIAGAGARSPLALGPLGWFALGALRHQARLEASVPLPELLARVGVVAARRGVRAAGTLAGYAALAKPGRLAALRRAGGPVPLSPSPSAEAAPWTPAPS